MSWPVSGLFLCWPRPFEGSFWNASETVLKQNDGPNAMVAMIWCHLTRASSEITKSYDNFETVKGTEPDEARRRPRRSPGVARCRAEIPDRGPFPGHVANSAKPNCTPIEVT